MTGGTPQRGLDPDGLVAFLAELFERRGGEEYLGERVTMAEHMLQAAWLAERAGEEESVIVAALLHDIGHFTGELGAFSMDDREDRHHEEAGAQLLARFLPPIVTDCVRHHVIAKRYLCTVEPAYLDALSAASRHSLELQGGCLSEDERRELDRHPNLDALLRVRRYDDEAKVAGRSTPPFSHYAGAVRRQTEAHTGR